MPEYQETTKPKILIVEDETIIAFDPKSHLEQMGYTVLAQVNSAEKALELIEKDPPDLVLMAIVLKGKMDGIEAADIIRSQWGIPVVFCTAYADRDRLERSKLVYPFGTITMPFQDNDIKVTVEMALYVSKVNKEKRKADEALQEKTRLNQILLDAFPCVALLLRSQTREIVSSNAAAVRVGAVPGARCFGTWGQRDDPCPWCLAPAMWATGEAQHLEVEASGITWDAHWIPITEDLYMHFAFDITERKKAEEELRFQSEIITNMAEAVYLVRMEDGIIVYSNSILEKMFGYGQGEMIGKHVSIVNAPTEKKPKNTAKEIMDSLTVNGIWNGEVKNIRKDGEVFWSYASVTVFNHSKYGRVLVAIHTDISERKRAEKVLERERMDYQTILDAAPVMIAYKSKDDHFLKVNAAFAEFVGLPKEKILGMTTFDLVAEPDVAQQGRDHDLEVIRTGKPVLNHLVKWSGLFSQKEIWALYSKLPFYDSDGSIIGTVSFIVDIDDRKRAEDARQESEEKYRNLFNNAEVGIFRSKLDGSEVLEVNRRFLEIVGMSLEETVGKPSVNLWADPKEREEMVKRLVADGSVQAFEYKMLNKRQGDVRDCLTSLRLYREQGILEGSILDITERKRGEEQLQQTLDSLRRAFGTTIQVMVSAVETRDPYTAGHQLRSADLARAIATEMGLPQDKIDSIRMAGSIHDIGKLSVPAEILSKPIKLSELEFSLIKEHAHRGYEILKKVESPWPLAETVYQHHERMDGSGYPRGLKGDEILIEARILAVADVVEAMASHRPYRPALGIEKALEEISQNKGILYDSKAVEVCLKLFREKGYHFN